MQWVEMFYEVLKIYAPAFLQYISSVYDLSSKRSMNVRVCVCGGEKLILGFQSNFTTLGYVQANQFYVALFACTFPKFYVFKQVTLKP